jgi:hypothetical protein
VNGDFVSVDCCRWVAMLWMLSLGGDVVDVVAGWRCCGCCRWVAMLWMLSLGGDVVDVVVGWRCCGCCRWVAMLWMLSLGGDVVGTSRFNVSFCSCLLCQGIRIQGLCFLTLAEAKADPLQQAAVQYFREMKDRITKDKAKNVELPDHVVKAMEEEALSEKKRLGLYDLNIPVRKTLSLKDIEH